MEVYQKNIKQLWNQLKSSAKKRNIKFSITPSDLNNITFPLKCPILGIELKFNKGKPQDNSYSIDRIDSSKGYEEDNIIVISHRANKLKSNASLNELKLIYEYFNNLNEMI